MTKNTLILILSCCIVLLSAAVLAVGPISNKKIGTTWGYQNCNLIGDQIDTLEYDSQRLKDMEHLCNRQKAMYDLEYCAFIINVVAGFICADLALLHYMEISKDFDVQAGGISFAAGLIGLVLSVTYVCYNGYIFNNDIAYLEIGFNHGNFDFITGNAIEKLYSNGAKEQWNGQEYVTTYEDNRDTFAQFIKYKDLIKSQYNFDSDYYKKYNGYIETDGEIYKCRESSPDSNCKYIYKSPETENTNRELYNRWLTALILGCVVALCNLGLLVFGLFSFANFGSFMN